MFAEATSVHDKMIGIFGMPQLNKLKYLLDGDEYREDAKIEIITSTRNNVTVPSGLHFENKDGDFKNDYHAFKGNAYGLANTLDQTAILKPSLISKKIKNLYFAGQLTVPGPGVPPSIISGKVAATQIFKEMGN